MTRDLQEVIKKVYDHLLVKVLSISKDALYTPKYSALHVLDHPELFDEASHVIYFIRSMCVYFKIHTHMKHTHTHTHTY